MICLVRPRPVRLWRVFLFCIFFENLVQRRGKKCPKFAFANRAITFNFVECDLADVAQLVRA